jgi:hypothetical protein
MKLFGIVKKAGTLITAGFVDRITTRLSGQKCSFGKHIAAKLYECEPWTDHLLVSTFKNINIAIADRNFEKARFLLGIGATEGANLHCIDVAHQAINLIAQGEEFICSFFIHEEL